MASGIINNLAPVYEYNDLNYSLASGAEPIFHTFYLPSGYYLITLKVNWGAGQYERYLRIDGDDDSQLRHQYEGNCSSDFISGIVKTKGQIVVKIYQNSGSSTTIPVYVRVIRL